MNGLRFLAIFALFFCGQGATQGAEARIKKVLAQYLDREGRHLLSPSLYERDTYQDHLRRHPQERGGLRFAVNWKPGLTSLLTMRVELRGSRGQDPTTATLQTSGPHRGRRTKWSSVALQGDAYKDLGEMVAWRVTLWEGTKLVADQKSFLW